ncbi:MAG TPA: C40 family peptidase [Burkholderiaceae bacterium]|nr:C40 family peptidase [Burkholderiaceae bacterium]
MLARNNNNLWSSLQFCLVIGTLVLSGCASNPSSTTQAQNARNQHLSQTRADPLGAYLGAKVSSLDRNYPFNQIPDDSLATTALQQLGIKYKFGGGSPNTGFDCSGLVRYAAEKSLGLKLPRSSAQMARQGTPVKRTELKKGDLVFFNTRGHRFSHVGIYLGDKKFVHSPRSGSVVRIESMDIAYWKKRYNGARRLPNATSIDTLIASSN